MSGERWDVFCRVVDNYGDAGVCWRLARQLAAEHGLDVTLWIDQIGTLARFEPAIDPQAATQRSHGIQLRLLDDALAPEVLPDVVVEAFGCGLPESYLDAMEASARPPLWFNLEYLSAEPWVDAVHGLASPQPQRALTRHFWFPGFTTCTGGLIREAGQLGSPARDALSGEAPAAALRIVLFCYPNPALPALFDTWAEGDEAIECVVPEGVAVAALDRWLQGNVPSANQSLTRGRLTLCIRPFSSQESFDELLATAGVNFVRGEDSFVRAQWVARPFVWQPYPQDEDAHTLKLDAFLARFTAELAEPARGALIAFCRAFSSGDDVAAALAWPAFRAQTAALAQHGQRWATHLATLPDLASSLAKFAANKL